MAKKTETAPAENPRLEPARISARDFAQSDVLSGSAVRAIVAAVKGATFTEWEGVRMTWVGVYRDVRKVDENAGDKAWGRLIKAAELTKPKAETKAATEKSQKRSAERERLSSVKDLDAAIKTAGEQAATGDSASAKEVAKLSAEKARRAKEAGKATDDMAKKIREELAKTLKGFNLEELHKVQAFVATVRAIPAAPAKSEGKSESRKLKKAA